MKLKKMAHELRMILYKNTDYETLKTEFDRVLESFECEAILTIFDSNKAFIVDIESYIQFIKTKGFNMKIYESIPKGSPLEKYKESNRWQKKKMIFAKSVEKNHKCTLH